MFCLFNLTILYIYIFIYIKYAYTILSGHLLNKETWMIWSKGLFYSLGNYTSYKFEIASTFSFPFALSRLELPLSGHWMWVFCVGGAAYQYHPLQNPYRCPCVDRLSHQVHGYGFLASDKLPSDHSCCQRFFLINPFGFHSNFICQSKTL